MKISHSKDVRRGRPSLPTLTAVCGTNHHSVNISMKLADSLNIKANNYVSLYTDICGRTYVSFTANQGAKICTKKNGKGGNIISLTFSSARICNHLLNLANETKKAIFLVGCKPTDIDGTIYYLVINKPIQ